MMQAMEVLTKYKQIVQPKLLEVLNTVPDYANFAPQEKFAQKIKVHKDLMLDYPQRNSKYSRPTLVLLSCLAMGGDLGSAINTACAMQISEEWILMHDDFEDNSKKRRGQKTHHRMYGAPLCVNSGDALHVYMWGAIMQNFKDLDFDVAQAISQEFDTMLKRTVMGQTAEILYTKDDISSFGPEDYYFIVDGKTSYYTIAGPMVLGAVLAGATREQILHIKMFGQYMGRVYQIVDDVLDIETDFMGNKIQNSDIIEGKRTLILAHLLKNLNNEDLQKLISIYTKPASKKTKQEVAWVASMMQSKGSLGYAKMQVDVFLQKALKIFDENLSFMAIEPYKTELSCLFNFFATRKH